MKNKPDTKSNKRQRVARLASGIFLRLGNLAEYVDGFQQKGGFENPQDAIRDILRDRKRQDEIEATQTR